MMKEEMKQKLIEIVDYLYLRRHDKDEVRAITLPLKTVEQINQMMEWLKQNEQATVKEIVQKALEIGG